MSESTFLYGINTITDLLLIDFPDYQLVTTEGQNDYQGKKVFSLKELAKKNFETVDKIIICSIFVDEITNSLLESGFSIDKILFYNVCSCKTQPVKSNILPKLKQDDTLYVVYDLATNLPCYDALSFAAVAESERIKRNLKHINFIIAPKSSQNNRAHIMSNYSNAEISWRMSHIVRPIFESLPSCISISSPPFREDVELIYASKENTFPERFNATSYSPPLGVRELNKYLESGQYMPALKVQPFATNLVNRFLESHNLVGKKLLTFTVRSSSTHTERNTLMKPWLEFIETINTEEYALVLIQDTSESTSANTLGTKWVDFPAASLDLYVRLALYEQAYINFSSSSGPSFSYYFIKGCSSIRFSPIDDSHFASSRKNIERAGYNIGEIQPFEQNGTHQVRLELETFPKLLSAFETQKEMLKKE